MNAMEKEFLRQKEKHKKRLLKMDEFCDCDSLVQLPNRCTACGKYAAWSVAYNLAADHMKKTYNWSPG